MPKYLSGRSKRTPDERLPLDRYEYLSISEAEPNPGYPEASGITVTGDSGSVIPGFIIPGGQKYQVISIFGDPNPGRRYWHPLEGGLKPGAVTFYKDNSQVSGTNSITQLDWYGIGVTFGINDYGSSSTDIRARIYVAPPGKVGELVFNETNPDYFGTGLARTDFSTSSDLIFNTTTGILTVGGGIHVGNSIVGFGSVFNVVAVGDTVLAGIGTTNPLHNLHVFGDVGISSGTIYDVNNFGGNEGDIILKNKNGYIEWKPRNQVASGAGGTIGNIQFHNALGFVEGASDWNGSSQTASNAFVWDSTNYRVGLGSTQPSAKLDVLGDSIFTGNFKVTGLSTFTEDIDADGDLDVDGYTELDDVNVSSASTFVGVGTFKKDLGVGRNLSIVGITTIGDIKISSNKIDCLDGNLTLESQGTFVQVNDQLKIDDTTESTTVDSGALQVDGGVGINKNLNVGGETSIAGGTEDTFDYKITTSATPTTAQVYFNQGAFNTTNQIKIHKQDVSGDDNSSLLALLKANDTIKVIDESDSEHIITYNLTGDPTLNGDVYVIPISYQEGDWGNLSTDDDIKITITWRQVVGVRLATLGGITTTGGDLFVNDDIVLDEARVQNLIVNPGVSTFHGDIHALSNVGIGTTNPASGSILHLNDSSACRLQLTTDSTGQGTNDGVRLMIDNSDNFEILQREDKNIEFFTHDVQRVTIDGDGKVGINSITPTQLLDVGGTTETKILRVSETSLLIGDTTLNNNIKVTGVSTFVGVSSFKGGVNFDNEDDAGKDVQWQPTNDRLSFFDNVLPSQ